MRIAHQSGSNTTWRRGAIFLLALLLIAPLGVLRAQEPVGPAEVSAANVQAANGSLIMDLGLSRPVGVRSFSLTSPDRLVFDIENATLALGNGAESSWQTPLDGVSNLTISQFSTQPPVVRIVAEITDLNLAADREVITGGVKLAVYRGTSPFADTGPGAPPERLTPTIQRFWHQALDDGRDKFTIEFTFGVVLPQIRIESPTVLLLRFPNTEIVLPASSPDDFATAVQGKVVERMRAERVDADGTTNTEIRLTVPDTSAVSYNLETASENTLDLRVSIERQSTPAPAPPETPAPEAAPTPVEGGQIMVLSSTDEVTQPSDAATHITRVQFQTLNINNAETDRFYIYYEGEALQPRVQRFNYPTRIIFYFPNSAVVLPDTSGDRFQTPVDGVVTDELKVFNRVIEDVGPECQFSFYFPNVAQENVGFTIDPSSEGEFHIDFYHSATPVNVESPVQVNVSLPGAETTQEEAEAPAQGLVEQVVTAENPAPAQVEAPAPVQPEPVQETPETAPAVVEQPAPAVVEEPAPIQTEAPIVLPRIIVTLGEVTDNTTTFHITTSEPMGTPEWVEMRFPDRLGLRFPLADVQLMDAAAGVYTSYTHVRSIPLVRAILKDRNNDRSSTIAWTLDGGIEEYTRDIQVNGNEVTVTFRYTPPPVAEPTPAVVEETPQPEVVPEAPVVEATVQPEPAVAEQPVVEQPAPFEEVTVMAETPPVASGPSEAPAPVAEVEAPIQLQTIAVNLGEVTDNRVIFDITTSEPLPMPEWVEYRYPDRLGLRFPLAVVRLLGDDASISTVNTRVPITPTIRTITKDRPEEQYTTITWTLGGSLEEFAREIDWNGGNNIKVTLTYNPIVVPPVVQSEITVQPEPVEQQVVQSPEIQVEVQVRGEEKPSEEPVTEKPQVVEVTVQAQTEEKPSEAAVAEEQVEKPVEEPKPVEAASVAEPGAAEKPETTGEGEAIAEVQVQPEPVMVEEAKPEETAVEEAPAPTAVPPPETGMGGNAAESFAGALITNVSFEKMGAADVFRFATNRRIGDWEIIPVNFPTKLLVTLPDTRMSLPNGNPPRYDEKFSGGWVDELAMQGIASPDTSTTTLSLYAHAVDSTERLMYDVQSTDNELVLAVFERGASSPLGPGGRSMATAPVGGETAGTPMPAAGGEGLVPVPVLGAPGGTPPAVNVTGTSETGPKISMRLEDANIRDVLQLIAEQANLSILVGPSVQGTITITLSEIGLFDLLDLLGAQLGFTYIVKSGVYVFGESSELQKQFGTWPRWYVSLSYADPDQVRSILVAMQVVSGDQITIYRGDYGTTSLSVAGPQLIIQGERRDLERAYRIIATLDQPPVMVQVDFQILNTSLTNNKNFGFQFHPGTGGYVGGTSLLFSEKPSADNAGAFPQGFERLRTTTNIYTIQAVINYLLEEGYAELMNRSSLTVANNQTGTLFVGENIPYRSTFQVSELGRVTQRVATQSVGLTLDFRPHANPDGTVTLVLRPQNSNLLELTDIGPRTVDQRFTTTVRVRDGEPFIIGGFIRDEERVNYDRFPFLSELPLLGHLFRNREVKETRSELIFVFTPHIINPQPQLPPVRTDADLIVPQPSSPVAGY